MAKIRHFKENSNILEEHKAEKNILFIQFMILMESWSIIKFGIKKEKRWTKYNDHNDL